MEVSYKKLWKMLIDKDMKKKDLQAKAGISWANNQLSLPNDWSDRKYRISRYSVFAI